MRRYLCLKCRTRVFKGIDAVCPNAECGAVRTKNKENMLMVFHAIDLKAQLQRLFALKQWAKDVKAHAQCPPPEKNETGEEVVVEVRGDRTILHVTAVRQTFVCGKCLRTTDH